MRQRALSFLLAAVLALALVPTAWAAETFTDVPSTHWAYDDIQACAESGIVTGMGDGKFHPNDNVTGIQFIVMLTRTFYNDMVEAARETETSSWYAPNMKVANDVNMLKFDAVVKDAAMNRYEMAKVLYCVLRQEGKTTSVTDSSDTQSKIKDYDSIPSNRQTQVEICYYLGVLTGMSDSTFSGSQSMTRAQACAIIVRMMNLIHE